VRHRVRDDDITPLPLKISGAMNGVPCVAGYAGKPMFSNILARVLCAIAGVVSSLPDRSVVVCLPAGWNTEIHSCSQGRADGDRLRI
jgi:hypothetical protein